MRFKCNIVVALLPQLVQYLKKACLTSKNHLLTIRNSSIFQLSHTLLGRLYDH